MRVEKSKTSAEVNDDGKPKGDCAPVHRPISSPFRVCPTIAEEQCNLVVAFGKEGAAEIPSLRA